MALRELLHFKNRFCCFFIIVLLTTGCFSKTKEQPESLVVEKVDISQIPLDTVSIKNPALKLDNGIFYLDTKPYAGYITERYENGNVKSITSLYKGMQQGITKSFYPDGTPGDERMYRQNLSYGRHFGYWQNGNMKFDFTYYNDKREGLQKQWYESGQRYAFLTFKNDKEDGMQQAWRENGKPYINYQAKDGFRYGLQKSGLCYTLIDEKLKTKK